MRRPLRLARGNHATRSRRGSAHVWNEVALDDGVRILVATTLEGAQPRILEVSDPEIVRSYRKVDDSPWYGPIK